MRDQRSVRAACPPKGILGQRRPMFLTRQEQTPSPRAGTRQVGRPVPGNSGLGGDSIRLRGGWRLQEVERWGVLGSGLALAEGGRPALACPLLR